MNSGGEYEKFDTDGEKISSQEYFIEKAEREEKVKQENIYRQYEDIVVEREEKTSKVGFFQKLINLFKN